MGLTNPQKEVINNKARFRVLISGRRFGKTFLAINELARFARFPNKKVWYIAPSYRQAKSICWVDLKDRVIKHKWDLKINDSDLSILLKNNSSISLRGADNEQSLRGVGLDFLVIDEFQDVKPYAWNEVLRPTLSDTQGHALFCGTPKGYNWAYDMYVKGTRDNDWKSFKYIEDIEKKAEEIWSNETKQEVDSMSKAIKQCIDIDIKNGIEPSLD